MDMIQVTEAEFIRNEQERREAFAAMIRDCGISLYELARGTRIKFDTILRASRGHSIRSANEERIRFYINIKKQLSNEEATN